MILPTTIERRIRLCHGRPTLLAADLAAVYGVSTRTLLECVRRRGPLAGEFAFFADANELKEGEYAERRGGGRLVFTEHGSIAAAYLVGTELALQRSIEIVRAFARFRGRTSDDRPAAGRSDVVAEPRTSYSTA